MDKKDIFVIVLAAIVVVGGAALFGSNSWFAGEETIAGQPVSMGNMQVASPTCTDSDGGKNKNVEGVTTLGSKVKTDYCYGVQAVDYASPLGGFYELADISSNGFVKKKVREYYCSNNRIRNKVINCPNGCYEGECITSNTPEIPTVLCNDNPNVNIVDERITVYNYNLGYNDHLEYYVDDCTQDGNLIQLSCSDQNMLVYDVVNCGFGKSCQKTPLLLIGGWGGYNAVRDYINQQGIAYPHLGIGGDEYSLMAGECVSTLSKT